MLYTEHVLNACWNFCLNFSVFKIRLQYSLLVLFSQSCSFARGLPWSSSSAVGPIAACHHRLLPPLPPSLFFFRRLHLPSSSSAVAAALHCGASLKRSKCDSGKFTFIERLKGAARLLSEMVEPMLKAATEISTLLARSFFMGFCVMVLALLARLRVLVQQILLDVVSVFNEVSSLSHKKQSIKITQDGLEVFREYYPTSEEDIAVLQCVWQNDKFVLVESSNKGERSHQGGSSEIVQTLGTSIKYQSIDSFLGDDEYDSENVDANEGEESVPNAKRKRPDSLPPICDGNISLAEQVQMPSSAEQGSVNMLQPGESTLLGGSSHVSSPSPLISSSPKPNSTSNKSVAFISVKSIAPLASNAVAVSPVTDSDDKKNDNSLFNFFNDAETSTSIF